MGGSQIVFLSDLYRTIFTFLFSLLIRKKGKKNEKNAAAGNEQTALLLGQQNVFMFDDCFTDVPMNKMPK